MKRIISIILVLISLSSITLCFAGCSKDVDDFTEAEHIQRITERIEKSDSTWGYPEGEKYESFEVYPVYDQYEELKYFLVEFEPYGFVFIRVKTEPSILVSCLHANKSMYVVGRIYGKKRPWTPHTRTPNSPPLPSFVEGWASSRNGDLILDENGDMIIYEKSPYFVTGNSEERKYLLQTKDSTSDFICAIKQEGQYVNLISKLKIEDIENLSYREHATLDVTSYAHKSNDL
ncbi:MAG: hypothetical protein IJZ73_00325 [Clostridia bacterium]|nr:hypothetical protein [Clostridia bacterium]